MKTLRRIEMTTFRRRTTAIVRDWERVTGVTPLPGLAEAPAPSRSDPADTEKSDLKKTIQSQPCNLFPPSSKK